MSDKTANSVKPTPNLYGTLRIRKETQGTQMNPYLGKQGGQTNKKQGNGCAQNRFLELPRFYPSAKKPCKSFLSTYNGV